MGNKAGYAESILWMLGLTAGKSAGAYVWAEADDDVRALLQAYPDPAMLLRIAEIIRGWADEEPRALWERLRAERKARVMTSNPEDVAGWITSGNLSYRASEIESGFNPGMAKNAASPCWRPDTGATATLANFAMLASSNRLINVAGPDLMNTGQGGTTFGNEFATPAADVSARFEQVAGEVAAHAVETWLSYGQSLDRGFRSTAGGYWPDTPPDAQTIGARVNAIRSSWPAVAVLPRIPPGADLSALLGTPGDLSGVVVYMDPPYVGTTGYLHDLGRADVVRHALDLSGLGATVAISEAEPLPELVAAGWYVADLTAGRKGQKRTFSKQQREYLTMTTEPRYIIPEQVGMFG
jgi:hypothetical protein